MFNSDFKFTLTPKKELTKAELIQKLREATDSIEPHFTYKNIPLYVSSEVPENEIWFITPDTHLELKL